MPPAAFEAGALVGTEAEVSLPLPDGARRSHPRTDSTESDLNQARGPNEKLAVHQGIRTQVAT